MECEFVRTGRKFTHIIFSVKNRPNILVERTQSVPPEDVPDVRDLVGYTDEDWQNLTLSDSQRNYFASLLSRHNDGGVGNRFAGEFINAAGREGYSQESWKRWIENRLADPKFVYEARVYLHDLGFKPLSAVKKNVKRPQIKTSTKQLLGCFGFRSHGFLKDIVVFFTLFKLLRL